MSIKLGELCSVILQEHFGENVRLVGACLFSAYSRSLSSIIKSTKLSKLEIIEALAILLKFRLAKYEPSSTNENVAEYSLIIEKVLLILRYSRYVHLIQTKYGHEAALLTEELLRSGSHTASNIILKTILNIDNKENETLVECKEKFTELVQSNYFIRAPAILESGSSIPKFSVDDASNLFVPPIIDIPILIKLQKGEKVAIKDEGIYWLVNFDRFHQDFRDSIMISAIERQIDPNAGECLRFILLTMYARTDPWKTTSNPISFVEIKQACEKKSNNLELMKYLDQYISVIVDDSLKFLYKSSDMGGGQYTIQMNNAFEQLAWACIENIINEKFGSKAARIFRVVRKKKYIEQEEIQKQAMVPAKEAKQLTYKLLEEHFLQIHTIRKAGGGGSGMAKSFYLFYVNQTQIVSMLLETCYQALFNSITRSTYDRDVNKRLIDKSQRLESIIEAMKDRGESEDYIAEILETLTPPEREILKKVKIRVKSLYSAEIGLDETIFLLQLFQYYNNTANK